MTESLLGSLGVCQLILTMLWFGWSPFLVWFLILVLLLLLLLLFDLNPEKYLSTIFAVNQENNFSGRTSRVNAQNQIVQSGNYCYSSIRAASIDKIRKSCQRKITMTLIQTICPNCISLRVGKQGGAKVKPKPKLLKCRNTEHRTHSDI